MTALSAISSCVHCQAGAKPTNGEFDVSVGDHFNTIRQNQRFVQAHQSLSGKNGSRIQNIGGLLFFGAIVGGGIAFGVLGYKGQLRSNWKIPTMATSAGIVTSVFAFGVGNSLVRADCERIVKEHTR